MCRTRNAIRMNHPMSFEEGPMAWLARRDDTVVVGHGPFRAEEAPPTHGVAFFVSDFGLKSRAPWQVPARYEVLDGDAFRQSATTGAIDAGVVWQMPDASDFAVVFQEILAAIQCGEFEKTVPVVTERGVGGGRPARHVGAAMAAQQLPLHSYGWLAGGSGFAGATPELLFALDGLSLETMALAGTARSEDLDAFAVDEKEIREHEFVARTLIAKLSNLGDIDRRPRETLDLGPIVHFHSPIHVGLRHPADAGELIRLLHPTPALGPLPRTPETLAQLGHWRARLGAPDSFGAPFGVWHDGRFEAVVAIRGIWWNDRSLRLPAGCGVIEASRLVNEWRELRLKREAVRRFLAG